MNHSFPETETFITLVDAAKLCPSRPSPQTVWRWASGGLKARRLETWKIGGRRYTTKEALYRFLANRQDSTTLSEAAIQHLPLKAQVAVGRSIEAAERELDQEGIL